MNRFSIKEEANFEIVKIFELVKSSLEIANLPGFAGDRKQKEMSLSTLIFRLNSGNRNRHNFIMLAILTFEKTGTDSVNHSDSGDVKILFEFPGNSILKFWVKF